MEKVIKLSLIIFIIVFVTQGCKDDDELAATGILTGTVTDAITGEAPRESRVHMFNRDVSDYGPKSAKLIVDAPILFWCNAVGVQALARIIQA